ncbi:hypothetical protein [Streptomyces sp. NPDC088733]|uniref:hypothetical protein n=1 Tax=Streptomyces sp. NPDC088733 TaxID=3365880 RepID=UPI003812D0F2
MAHVEERDGYVVDPPVIKTLVLISELDQALELLQSATQLGFGIRLTNSMNELRGELKETWTLEILDDIPLDVDDDEEEESEEPAK